MSREDMKQHFCCRIQFTGKRAVMFGTVVCRVNALHHEIEAALRARVQDCLPDGWTMLSVLPGGVFFAPAEGQQWEPGK